MVTATLFHDGGAPSEKILLRRQREVNPFSHRIDTVDAHPYGITDAVYAFAALPAEAVQFLNIMVVIIGERGDVHQPLDEELAELHE